VGKHGGGSGRVFRVPVAKTVPEELFAVVELFVEGNVRDRGNGASRDCEGSPGSGLGWEEGEKTTRTRKRGTVVAIPAAVGVGSNRKGEIAAAVVHMN
jgi:hypothetical protein